MKLAFTAQWINVVSTVERKLGIKKVDKIQGAPQSADKRGAFGILEKARGNLRRKSFLPWSAQCNHGSRRSPEVAAVCALRKRQTLRAEFQKGGLPIR
jgi:hypothetical protein